MYNFLSNLNLNTQFSIIFNKETLISIPVKLTHASGKEKVAGIAICCTMMTVPLYVYKKFVAKRVEETSSIIASSNRVTSFVIDFENFKDILKINGESTQKNVNLRHSYSDTTLASRSALVASPFLIRKKRAKKNKLNSQDEINTKEKKLNKACKALSKHCNEITEYLMDPKVMDCGKDVLNFLLFYVHKVNGTIRKLEIDGLTKIQLFHNIDEILYDHPTKPCTFEELEVMRNPNPKWKEELATEIKLQNSEIKSILRKRH